MCYRGITDERHGERTVIVSLCTVQQKITMPSKRCPMRWTMMISQYILNMYFRELWMCMRYSQQKREDLQTVCKSTYNRTGTCGLQLQACRRNTELFKKKYEVYKVIKHRWEVFVGVETRLEVLHYKVVFLLDCDTLLQLQSAHRQSLFRFHLHLASCGPKYVFIAPQWSHFFPM